MNKTMLIHDLTEEGLDAALGALPGHVLPFAAKPAVKHCIGCFGCWVKSPGACVIRDRASVIPSMMAASGELVVVSRCVYGGFSPDVKAVMDRCIGYLMPFFRIVNGEMHHTMRYDNHLTFTVHLYGAANEAERGIAQKLVAANALNIGAGAHSLRQYATMEEMRGAIL